MSTRSVALVVLPLFALLIPAFVTPSSTPDWPAFYAAAQTAPHGSSALYSFEAPKRITSQFEDPTFVWAFVRPPFYAAALYPLGLLTPRAAFVAWQLANLAALTGFLFLIWPSPYAAIVAAIFAPLWASFRQGQDMPLLLLVVAVSIALLRSRRNLLAGLVLSLCVVKFHLLFLFPISLLARKAGRLTAGFAIGVIALVAVCFALYGPQWPVEYYRCVIANEKHLTTASLLRTPWGILVAFIAAVGCYLLSRKVAELEFALAGSLAMSLLVAPRMYPYDAVIALPAFLFLVRHYFPIQSEVHLRSKLTLNEETTRA